MSCEKRTGEKKGAQFDLSFGTFRKKDTAPKPVNEDKRIKIDLAVLIAKLDTDEGITLSPEERELIKLLIIDELMNRGILFLAREKYKSDDLSTDIKQNLNDLKKSVIKDMHHGFNHQFSNNFFEKTSKK